MSKTYEVAAIKARTHSGFVANTGSVSGVRDSWPMPAKYRRRCSCGCKTRATHVGGNNAIALTSGCELSVRRWVRDGSAALRGAGNE